jgi:protein O-GlcNAc transferase
LKLGNNELAVEAYKMALKLGSRESNTYFNLGLAYARSGYSEEAINSYCTAAELDPSNPKIQYVLGIELFTMERSIESIAALQRANKLTSEKPEKAEILSTMGTVYIEADQPAEAVKSFELAIANGARGVNTFYFLGLSYRCLGRNLDAESSLQSAIGGDPNHTGARCALGEVYIRLGRYSEAITALKIAIQKDPSSAKSHLFLGIAYWKTDQAEMAIEHLRSAFRLDPTGETGQKAKAILEPTLSLLRDGLTPREIREASW